MALRPCQHGGYLGSEGGLEQAPPLGGRVGERPQRVSDIARHAPSLQKVCSLCLCRKSPPEYYLETGFYWRTAA